MGGAAVTRDPLLLQVKSETVALMLGIRDTMFLVASLLAFGTSGCRDPDGFKLTAEAYLNAGYITSSPPGIACRDEPVCKSAYFPAGTVVTLSVEAARNFRFDGFEYDDDCKDGVVTMNEDHWCHAGFTFAPEPRDAGASPDAAVSDSSPSDAALADAIAVDAAGADSRPSDTSLIDAVVCGNLDQPCCTGPASACVTGLSCQGSSVTSCQRIPDASQSSLIMVGCHCIGAGFGEFASTCADLPGCATGSPAPAGTCDSVCPNGSDGSSCLPGSPGC